MLRRSKPARPARRAVGLISLVAIIAAFLLGAGPANAEPGVGPAPVTTEVSFRNGDLTLHGTVYAPAGDHGRHPGIVMVHGSGSGVPRERFRAEAEAFARAGIVTLIYDKRSVGYSSTNRSFATLADDALAGVRTLRERPDVDPALVGLWGLSEGGWVAPLAASRSSDVAFLVVLGANGGTPSRQQAWNLRNRVDSQGASGSFVPAITETLMRLMVEAGLFPEAHYDPVPVLAKVRQPVLAMWGTKDTLTPPMSSATVFADTLRRSGNTHYTLRFFQDADHALHLTPDGFTRLPEFTPGYLDQVTSWVDALRKGPPAASADALPQQELPAPELPPLRWYESVGVQLTVYFALVLAFAGYLVTAGVRRLRKRRGVPSVDRPALWLATGGLLNTLGFLGYLGFLLTNSARNIGPVMVGRPVAWLVLQLLAVGTVAATVWIAVAWRRNHDRFDTGTVIRFGALLGGGVLFVPWALYWGLLVP